MAIQELKSRYPNSVYQGFDDERTYTARNTGAWFRALENQHQKIMAYLHAAQKGEIEIDGLSEKQINGAISWARKELRWARRVAVSRGDIQPYPNVQQMKKIYTLPIEITNGHLNGFEHLNSNGHSNGNGQNGHEKEDLSKYQITIPAAEEKIPA